jgi:hypothetical protein
MSTGDPLGPLTDFDPWAPPPPAAGPPVSRRRRGPVIVVVAVLAVLALVGSAVVVLSRDGGPAAVAGGRVGSTSAASRDRAVRAILDRRALAVLHRDERAWLADVDPQATDFRRAQQVVFSNLSQVRFASWSYQLVGRDYDRPDLADDYDVPYHLPAVLLHYAIKGYDLGPVARPQAPTFVLRGKHWYIASDSDADQDLPETGHADPWDRRAMVAREGSHVLVLADADDQGRLAALVHVADGAVTKVARMWPGGWRRKVVVVAVRDQRLIETYFRTDLQSSKNVAAIAVPAYDDVPGWTPADATTYDQHSGAAPRSRVILNPRYFDPSDQENAVVLTHEVTHVATQAKTFPGAPTWLVEGIADYTAYRTLRPFAIRLPGSVRAQVRSGSVELPTYDFYEHDVPAHYVDGFLVCAFVAHRYGEATLRRYYRELAATTREFRSDARTRSVSRAVLGLSTQQLGHQVAAYAAGISR